MIRRFDEDQPEWMDVAEEASPALERDLRNLASLNRRFGAWKAVLAKLTPLLRQREPLHILDLATGSGDIPRVIVREARKLRCPVSITAVERQRATLQIAEQKSDGYPEIRFVQADILTYEPASSADIVMCNLVLHHFDETNVIRLLRRIPRMANRGVLVTDLCRSRLAQMAVVAVTELFYREPMTRHDAYVSTQRALSFAELKRLAIAAGWWGFEHRRIPFFRQMLWLERGL